MVTANIWHVEKRRELLEELGKVTVRWAALDLLLVDILNIALANAAVAVDLILDSANAGKQRLDKFDRAIGASRFDEAERKKLLEATQRFAEILGTRNDIVHSPLLVAWSVQGQKITPNLQQMRRTGQGRPFNPKMLRDHLNLLSARLSELETIRDELAEKYLEPQDVD